MEENNDEQKNAWWSLGTSLISLGLIIYIFMVLAG